MRFLDEKRKNVLRAYVAQAASVLEIIITVLAVMIAERKKKKEQKEPADGEA